MAVTEIDLIGEQLKATGYYKTSWEELGLEYDADAIQAVFDAIPNVPPRVVDIDEMPIKCTITNSECDAAIQRLGAPVIEYLFSGIQNQFARERRRVFGANYYLTGDFFTHHKDYRRPEIMTAVVLSLSGVRNLVVSGQGHRMEPGSIMLIDGMHNPVHSAQCLEGPSISAVIDVPELLYPRGSFQKNAVVNATA